MKEEKKIMYTIRGKRMSIELTKAVKGSPMLSQSDYESHVGEVVFNFPHNEECVYFQNSTDNIPILNKQDIEQILEIMNRPFNEEDWVNNIN